MASDLLTRRREEALRAASRSLAETLDRDPAAGPLLAVEGPPPDGGTYTALLAGALESQGADEVLRVRRRHLAALAARDLAGELTLEQVGMALAGLADACLSAALVAVGAPKDLSVIGMGKLGGRELNYASDIDVMFVAGHDPQAATPAAEAVLRFLGRHIPEGQPYRIDVDLRPEGRSGALVRSLDGYLEYYRRWAEEWEFQALIKARHSAGDAPTGEALVEQTRSLVFPDEVDAERVVAIRRMKERVETHATRAARRSRTAEHDDVKLGPGGIRDIEFVVQLLQLVHGGSDPAVREAGTIPALDALVERGYVAEDDGAGLEVAYRWLRTVEHRLQLWQERPVRALPSDVVDRKRLARVMGFNDSPAASATESFDRRHRAVLADVRGRFEKLFYRPMIESLAGIAPHQLSQEALGKRLQVLGFRDVDRAARTLTGLVSGPSRRARLLRVLTPAMLRWLASTPAPDEGLFGFLRLGDALGDHVDLLSGFRDNPPGLALLARVLGSGRVLGDLLVHVPEQLTVLGDARGPRPPRDRNRAVREAVASLEWREPAGRLDGLRRYKRRAMVDVAVADLAGLVDVPAVGQSLSNIADACLEAALGESHDSFAVIGMGKLGGRELSYASDVDVIFVYDEDHPQAEKTAEALLKSIGEVTPEGKAFQIDAALRPEGKAGPLARSLDSYSEYYERWAKPWEQLALMKARPAAGDADLGARFMQRMSVHAWPAEIEAEHLADIRHLKARMERERIRRGIDPRRHFKLGPGGMSDIEFAVQMIQIQNGSDIPSLRTPGTLDALAAALEAELLEAGDANLLDDAYRFFATLRNRLFMLTGRPSGSLPARPELLESLGIAMGYEAQPRQELEETYLRTTRRVRRVAEPLIYG